MDNRRAVIHARIFLVLRPPKHVADPTQKYARLTAKHRRELALYGNKRPSSPVRGDKIGSNSSGNNNDDAENAPKPSDEECIVRDFDADDEADEVWDPHAVEIFPLMMPVSLATATVSDVLQSAWPYVVESYRDHGRFWHDDAVPQPLSTASPWFALRMIGKRWHDPTRAEERNCLEPPVAATLSDFESPDFVALTNSLHGCSFQERALLPHTLLRKILPADIRAKGAHGGASAAALLLRAAAASSSNYFTGRASGNAKKNAHAAATHYRINFLMTLSTPYLLLENLSCCESRTREMIFATVTGFLGKMKGIEEKSLECACVRTQHREKVEKMFTDLIAQEGRRRERIYENEQLIFQVHLARPYETTQAAILPVLRESHRIREAWRTRLAEDFERERENLVLERWRQQQREQSNDMQ